MLLIVALCVPWVTQAQDLSDYEFRTGVDNSAWITLSNPTTLLGDGTYVDDSPASSITNIGFNFPFGDGSYSQFWVNANGMFSMAPSTTTTTTAGQFTSSYYSTALPKIIGIARDMSTGSNGYIKYQLMGTAPERVLVCEFALSYTYGSSYAGDVKWQIQLHEDSSKVVIVYGPAPGTVPSSFQSGLGAASDDIVILDPSTHAATYHTGSFATTYSTWHGAYRYYEFVRPNITCPKPMALAAVPSADQLDITWTAGGSETEWMVVVSDTIVDYVTTNSYSATDLQSNTPYTVRVYAICGVDDTSSAATAIFRTSCVFIEEAMLPVTENFETYGTGTTAFPTCWYKLGSTADRPYINATTSYGHNNTYGLYFYAAAGGYCYGVMPPVDPTVDLTTLQVSFWARQYSTSYNCDFVVGVMTDPANASTFTPVGQVHPNGTTYEFFEVPLTTYTGTGNYIAFQAVQHPGTSTA
ncbi:MAG: fibronectin type III domain-containing protein, partial [Bacteroidales bacterium]|nr:fibronectin type III domain-containing protein [Bacteroidales bacterium]